MPKLQQTEAGGAIIRLARATQMMVGAVTPAVISEFYRRAIRRLGVLRASGTRTVAFGLLFAVAPFVFAVPTYAADDSTVSVTVDQNAALQPAGNLYKATANVTVKTSKSFGFNLTMQADTSDLIHATDPTHKISAMTSVNPAELNSNQWGYALAPQATQFRKVPAVSDPAAVIADVTKAKPAGCANPDDCTKQVIFAANIDPAKLASGSYSTSITYTATAKPALKPFAWTDRTAKASPSEICQAGNTNSSCIVTLDPNMIPVKYTGTTTNAQWTSVADPEAANSGWYDYANKQWANAITVKPEARAKYHGFSRVVDQADILGFWVYIPRYAYEVMRRDGTDKPVKEQNFDIKFENTKTPKKRPLACKTGNGKDYRTECGVSRELPLTGGEVSTWSTHPAFTFGSKELNGIWFAKFETTGDVDEPTVLPNERHMIGDYGGIGIFYSVAKSLGVNDPQNIGGKSVSSPQNSHHLAKLSSYMANNNDWGVATYLSASKYGAGYNGVQINANDATHGNSNGTTGCGPWENGNIDSYGDGDGSWLRHKNISTGARGTQQACGKDNPQRAYNGTLGQLASTTNNPTGIYDMSGGGREYVAASYSDNLNNSSDEYFGYNAAHIPYVNTYNFRNLNSCTFATCGGQALYETNNGTCDNTGGNQWNGQALYMLDFSPSYPWFHRGGVSLGGSSAGLFFSLNYSGYTDGMYAFRVALAPTP